MGYQNNYRPRRLDILRTDILFDMSDLKEDLKHDVLTIKNLEFVQESMKRYTRGMERKRRAK
jgi:hypothetical protein